MNGTIWVRWLDSFSDNLKSKIENPKWWGFSVIAFMLVAGAVAQAQQPKVPRIGYLSNTEQANDSARFEAIRLALHELGYIEGQNLAIEYRSAEGNLDSGPCACGRVGASQGRYRRGSRRDPMGPGGQECDQDDSDRYDGRWDRSCRGRPG